MPPPPLIRRTAPHHVALETTLLAHGLPHRDALLLDRELRDLLTRAGSGAALIGVLNGTPIVGMTPDELLALLSPADRTPPPKSNTANLHPLCAQARHLATTVSTTIELAAAAGLRLLATGGLGGLHRDLAHHLDISSDLAALARWPVAVVASGVKSLLDVVGTRELLETLGVPVLGYRTDLFPAFYLPHAPTDGHTPPPAVDARFDDVRTLAACVRRTLCLTRRGVLIVQPVPAAEALDPAQLAAWQAQAADEALTQGISGRAVTPFVLGRLHELSGGATLRANLALVRANVTLAGELARAIAADLA